MKKLPDFRATPKEMGTEEIMRCMFGLKALESQVYLELAERGALTASELTRKFKKDRSTIQRALQSLSFVGLVYREQKNIRGGGYYFAYRALPFSEMKEAMKANVRKWCDAMISWIDALKP